MSQILLNTNTSPLLSSTPQNNNNNNNKRKAEQELPQEGEKNVKLLKEDIQLQEEGKENNKNNTSLDDSDEEEGGEVYGQFSDFVIKYEKEIHRVHKFILCRESEYFVNWFNMHPNENQITIPPLESKLKPGTFFSVHAMSKFIKLMYSRSDEEAINLIDLPYSGVDCHSGPFIGLCDFFQAEKNKNRMFVAVKKFFQWSGSEANVGQLDLLRYTDVYNWKQESDALMQHIGKDRRIKSRFASFLFREAWLKLSFHLREKILFITLGMNASQVEDFAEFNTKEVVSAVSDDDDESSVLELE